MADGVHVCPAPVQYLFFFLVVNFKSKRLKRGRVQGEGKTPIADHHLAESSKHGPCAAASAYTAGQASGFFPCLPRRRLPLACPENKIGHHRRRRRRMPTWSTVAFVPRLTPNPRRIQDRNSNWTALLALPLSLNLLTNPALRLLRRMNFVLQDRQSARSLLSPDGNTFGSDTEEWYPSDAEDDPYFKSLSDKFEVAADDVSEDEVDMEGHQRQSDLFANSALMHYNNDEKNKTKYELIRALTSCGIMDEKGCYGHVNFTAKGNQQDSKEELFFAEVRREGYLTFVPTCVVSLEGGKSVGGLYNTRYDNYNGMGVPIDAQHCYACSRKLKHPKDGSLSKNGYSHPPVYPSTQIAADQLKPMPSIPAVYPRPAPISRRLIPSLLPDEGRKPSQPAVDHAPRGLGIRAAVSARRHVKEPFIASAAVVRPPRLIITTEPEDQEPGSPTSPPCSPPSVDMNPSVSPRDSIFGYDTEEWHSLDAEDQYFKSTVDNFVIASEDGVKSTISDDDVDKPADHLRQSDNYAEIALKHYNNDEKNKVKYELIKAITSCGIMERRGCYGHVNFIAKGNQHDSKEELFFAEICCVRDTYVTTCVLSLEGGKKVVFGNPYTITTGGRRRRGCDDGHRAEPRMISSYLRHRHPPPRVTMMTILEDEPGSPTSPPRCDSPPSKDMKPAVLPTFGFGSDTDTEDEDDPYFKSLVDSFTSAAEDVCKPTLPEDNIDYRACHQRQSDLYAKSALLHYNADEKNRVKYELISAITSCGIVGDKGCYGHVVFVALDMNFSGRGMPIDAQHCYACGLRLKHPKNGSLYKSGHVACGDFYHG
ncbi:hypothetical protein EJB05_25330 [Eragrostis curvula]|uniref:DUF3615 domain-containing protein n=1 Tax=Eragrostis curvula TaxID=38414 RepID=A0A5J9VDL9_9POAL|nr:hypothetical protein EJB05_25330 [Eragrostis curvula]